MIGVTIACFKDMGNLPDVKDKLIIAVEECYKNMDSLQEMGTAAFKSVEERVADWSAMYYEELFDSVYEQYQNNERNLIFYTLF